MKSYNLCQRHTVHCLFGFVCPSTLNVFIVLFSSLMKKSVGLQFDGSVTVNPIENLPKSVFDF